MDDRQFHEGLKDPEQKNEEWGAAASYFAGLKRPQPGHEKRAWGSPVPLGIGDGQQSWLSQFEGSPLLEQAIALERHSLQMEAEDLAKRQQERAQNEGRMQQDQQRWDMQDQIRHQKRELELQLAEQSLGATATGGDQSLGKSEAGTVAPAGIVPASEEMPKLASYPIGEYAKTIGGNMVSGGLLGGAIGGVGSIPIGITKTLKAPKGKRKETLKKSVKDVPKHMLTGAGLGAAISGGLGVGNVAEDVMHLRKARALAATKAKTHVSAPATTSDGMGKLLPFRRPDPDPIKTAGKLTAALNRLSNKGRL